MNYYYNYTTNLRDDDFIVSDPDSVQYIDIPGVYTGWNPGQIYYVFSSNEDHQEKIHGLSPVSYTHLTLPTSKIV